MKGARPRMTSSVIRQKDHWLEIEMVEHQDEVVFRFGQRTMGFKTWEDRVEVEDRLSRRVALRAIILLIALNEMSPKKSVVLIDRIRKEWNRLNETIAKWEAEP